MTALIAAGLVIALLAYWRTVPVVQGVIRFVLSAIRALVLVAIAYLVLDPRFSRQESVQENPLVIVLVDKSASMSLPVHRESGERSRYEEALALAEQVEERLASAGARRRRFYFDTDLIEVAGDTLSPDGQGTDIVSALRATYAEYSGENLAGVVLFSDGMETEPALFRKRLPPLPVFTVGLGDTTPPEDVRIEAVDYSSVVRTPAKTKLRVQLVNTGRREKKVQVVLKEGGQTLVRSAVAALVGSSSMERTLELAFPRPQKRTFLVEARVEGEDSEKGNNTWEVVIEGRSAEARVLLVDSTPSWELHFLTELLSKEKTLSFEVATDAGTRVPGSRVRPLAGIASRLGDYDALVFLSLRGIGRDLASAAASFIEDGGKGLLVLPGPGSLFENASLWQPLARLLPVTARPPLAFNFGYVAVVPGPQAAPNPISADLIPVLEQEGWQQRSPLLGYYRPLAPKAGAEVLLKAESDGSPVLVFGKAGRGRVGVMAAGPLWR